MLMSHLNVHSNIIIVEITCRDKNYTRVLCVYIYVELNLIVNCCKSRTIKNYTRFITHSIILLSGCVIKVKPEVDVRV